MGIQFCASRPPADPSDRFGWQLGRCECDMSASNAMRIMLLLGYTDPAAAVRDGGPVSGIEFALRVSLAMTEGISAARSRWPEIRPDYWGQKLAELAAIAREAQDMGGQVGWS